jgi:hypothetical protein
MRSETRMPAAYSVALHHNPNHLRSGDSAKDSIEHRDRRESRNVKIDGVGVKRVGTFVVRGAAPCLP